MKIVIFCDTNVVFGLLLRISKWESIENSELIRYAKFFRIFISTYVVFEAKNNLKKKFDIFLEDEHIKIFLSYWLMLCESQQLQSESIQYVNDLDDAQILQDAIWISADYLITKNIWDFNVKGIQQKRGITTTDSLPNLN